MADPELEATLQGLVGHPMGEAGRRPGPDRVNLPMIRHWCAAFEDGDPVYTDAAVAARSRFGQIVAPPVMLQTWTLPAPIITGIAERGGAPTEIHGDSPLAAFDRAGYTGTLAVGSEFQVHRYVHLGETVFAESVLESVSEEKQTRRGPGYFVTWVTTYTVDDGEVVGTQRFRILKFTPGSP